MLSVETWPESAQRAWQMAHRFKRFLVVGAIGLAVNMGLLYLLHGVFGLQLGISSVIAVFVSMIVTFLLNEHWTWHDRGSGPILHRVIAYFPINLIGLAINVGILTLLNAGLAVIWR